VGGRLGAIALLALLVRAVVPSGYMLAEAENAHGRYLTVTMCIEHGGGSQIIDLNTGKRVDPKALNSKPGGKGEPKPAPCVFAAAAPLAPPLAQAELVVFRIAYDIDFGVVRDLRPGRGIPAPPPPSTGPPSDI
jgi:hypothetical protein